VSDVLDSGPDGPRGARGWDRWARGGRVRRWLGVAVVVGLAAVALAAAVRPPAHAPDSVPAAVLSIPQGEVKLDGRDQAAALSLILVNTGASSYLDAINGLPARLVFVPPRGGLPVPGGTGTRLPLAWPRVDCTTPADALGRDLGAARGRRLAGLDTPGRGFRPAWKRSINEVPAPGYPRGDQPTSGPSDGLAPFRRLKECTPGHPE
jgi:hypothetical protein